MHKATKILSCLLAFSALVVLSGCSGYKTKPEVTGVADDGLYLYCGNMRYTSDYQNGEELVSSLDIEGVTYDHLIYCDSRYFGDEAYIAIDYYESEDAERAGSCILKYDIKSKAHEVLYHGADEFGYIRFISGDKTRFAVDITDGYGGVAVIHDGELEEVLPEADISYSDNFVAYSDGDYIFYKSWGGEFEYIQPDYTGRHEIFGDVMYIYAHDSYRELPAEDELELTCAGFTAFNMATKKSFSRLPAQDMGSYELHAQSGYYSMGKIYDYTTRYRTRLGFNDYELYRFDPVQMQGVYVCDFPEAKTNWNYNSAELRGDYLVFDGVRPLFSGNFDYDTCYFNTVSGQFESDPELPPDTIFYSFGDYDFYITYNREALMSDYGYHALHCVNKVTGKDDVMAVKYGLAGSSDRIYNIGAVRDY